MTKDPIVTPFSARYGPNGMVCSTDQLASSAGVALLRKGGSAADAAVASLNNSKVVADGFLTVKKLLLTSVMPLTLAI